MIELHPEILRKHGSPEFAVLPYNEFKQVEEVLRNLAGSIPASDPRHGGFWDNLSAEELVRRQGVKSATDLSDFVWPCGPEDWDGFEPAVEQWRSSHEQ